MNEEKIKLMNAKFHSCLELEYSNSEYARMHHITVLTFMLQTGRYTEHYEDGALSMLKDFLSDPDNIPSKSTIRANNIRLEKLKKSKGGIFTKEPTKVLDTKVTILDVRLDSPSHYRDDILAWAKSVVEKFSNVIHIL